MRHPKVMFSIQKNSSVVIEPLKTVLRLAVRYSENKGFRPIFSDDPNINWKMFDNVGKKTFGSQNAESENSVSSYGDVSISIKVSPNKMSGLRLRQPIWKFKGKTLLGGNIGLPKLIGFGVETWAS